ncbi:hypothetical protein FHS00_000356 [Limimaricola variabilis]|uniref:Lipoprotein n=1 Tax=Limimaricola variabilis TaxID=1492771 RepID=A0ABR6HK21_9RHOB|nr:hypothetical protein [Limimaricola variabilis]MBB3710803.1 hypothetical protein [Limimaricola variabilis]WPY95360.1 hypothetical protein T8T21_04320 [Limimaricola variabilis]
MRRAALILIALALVAGCTPVRVVGDAAVGTAQLGLGAVDLVL